MTKNQNDQRNQKSDSKSHEQQTQEGKKKKEINPNSPMANKNKPQDSQKGNQKGQNSTRVEADTDIQDTDENQEEMTDEKPSTRKTVGFNSKDTKNGTGNQNSKKGNM